MLHVARRSTRPKTQPRSAARGKAIHLTSALGHPRSSEPPHFVCAASSAFFRSPLRAAFHAFSRLGHCPCRPKPADYPLAEAFRLRDAEAPQLGAGISNKICAAFRPGISNVPTGTSDVNGVKWRLVVDEARLTPEEIVNFLIWLEDAHGAEIAARSQPLSCPPVRWSFRH